MKRLRKMSRHVPSNSRSSNEQKNSPDLSISQISRHNCRSELKFEKQLRDFVKARDRVIENSLSFEQDTKNKLIFKQGHPILENQLKKDIKEDVKQFLIQVTNNMLSAEFKFLMEKKINDPDAQLFTNNIWVNFKPIFQLTSNTIKTHPTFKNKEQIKGVMIRLMLEVEKIIDKTPIALNNFDPQMTSVMFLGGIIDEFSQINKQVNNSSHFKMSDYFQLSKFKKLPYCFNSQDDEQYTQFIVRLVTTAAWITQNNQEIQSERINFKKFIEFTQELKRKSQEKKENKHIPYVTNNAQFVQINNQISRGKFHSK